MASVKNKIARSKVLSASRKETNYIRRGEWSYGPKPVRLAAPGILAQILGLTRKKGGK